MKYLTVVLFLLAFFQQVINAQEKKLIQLTGKITDELLQPLPFAHVLVLENYRGALSNTYGNFSVVVEESDSVLISAVGYKSKYLSIPQNYPGHFMNVDIILRIDTLVIAEAQIYPWKNYEEFKEAFVNLKLPTDNMEKARRNIALIRTQIIMDREPSARANFNYIMEKQYQQTFTQGQLPSYQILNPFAWAKFFQALKRGDFKYDRSKESEE
jgi:CarboxypepD_reg-like domain